MVWCGVFARVSLNLMFACFVSSLQIVALLFRGPPLFVCMRVYACFLLCLRACFRVHVFVCVRMACSCALTHTQVRTGCARDAF